jgi:hypothetical protein
LTPRLALFGAVLAGSLVIRSGAVEAAPEMTKQQCIAADTHGQELRRSGSFAAARAELATCASDMCPALVRGDCTERLSELDASQPTIVFEVTDNAGHDLADVRVLVDGAVLSARLSGVAVPVDPGEHTFRFEAPGASPTTRRWIIREGEKARAERIALAVGRTPELPPIRSATAAATPPKGEDRTEPSADGQREIGLVAGGVGIAGIAVGAVFGLLAIHAKNEQHTDCGSTASCVDRGSAISDHASATTLATLSSATFIGGAILAAAGVILYLTAPPQSSTPRATAGRAGLGAAW